MSAKYYSEFIGQTFLKKKSRDAARSRRGQQNDEFQELASQLPISPSQASQLDRLSIMRLANSFVKIKEVLSHLTNKGCEQLILKKETSDDNYVENLISEALDGFVFVIGSDGRCLYISDNVSRYLGLLPIEMIGNSFYKYVHPCDHEEVAKELCGKIPLEDMEIFDGLFCSDSVFMMSNNLKGGCKDKKDVEKQPHRSFFVRIKSTLTSRGKSVNLKASTYRVVHCMGCLKVVGNGTESDKKDSPLCFVGIGVPLMYTSTFEVPLDQATFSSHHSLDLSFIFTENSIEQILGYSPSEVLGQSLFKFLHGCDEDVLANCHKTLLTKGQCVSGYYRLLAKYGGWVWVQTKASIVYASKTCQPQFVLCIHYAISGIEHENETVSLDQVERQREKLESPGNSPADRTEYNKANQKRLPVIQKCPNKTTLEFQTAGDTNQVYGDNSSLEMDLSIDMDLTDVCFNKEMPEISEKVASESEGYFMLLDDNQITTNTKEYEHANSPFIPSPSCDISLFPEAEGNFEQYAPFIPSPLDDKQFSSDEKELEMFSLNSPFACDDFAMENDEILENDEIWEISNEFCKEINGSQKGFMKRNLSTPTFFSSTEKIIP